jgi:radical SAM superfamily enzyme YgiQ (UPF0313 family)
MPFAYDPPVFRPPSEAGSLILQVTLGCSHNRCTFCSMYRTKRFRAKPIDQVREEIAQARRLAGPDVRRVFLADGDAMCLSVARLTEILDALHAEFPRVRRVGSYANARDLLRKSPEDLAALQARKLSIVYLGLESGDDATLADLEKGATAAECVEAIRRANAAGISTSVMVLVGVAGRERSLEHARRSAEAVNRMEPSYTALLTYTPTPGSPLGERVLRGEVELPGPVESLEEIRSFVAGLRCATYFTCNHASNYLPITGRLPGARTDILAALDAAIAGRLALKPEFMRGL